MKALVTGGAGFIGSNLVDALLARGDKVCVIDNLSTGRRENLSGALARGARLIEGDITDADVVEATVVECAPDVIFHLAAQIDVRRSVADPAGDARVNIEGTINLLAAAAAHGRPRFVYSSTGGAAYGECDELPTAEDHAVNPEAPYGQAKVAAEGYCALFGRMHGLSTIALRYGNVYGPRQDPLGEAGVVAIFCGRLLAGERPTVYGDGRQTRDYVYVNDIVAANLAAAASVAEGSYNIGAGVETSVLDLIDELAPHAAHDGYNFSPTFAPERAGELRRSALDASRARESLGWQPSVGLAEGLALTLEATRLASAAV